jgi:hypothetical protein
MIVQGMLYCAALGGRPGSRSPWTAILSGLPRCG